MKRRAVIIANPGQEGTESYLGGVEMDVMNYRSFLLSPFGGLWSGDEIVEMTLPSIALVRREIERLSGYDYALIIFSGHGRYSTPLNSTVLELRKGEEIDSAELRRGAPKQTMILDCCRFKSAAIPTMLVDSRALAKAASAINPDSCRRCYDESIQKCAPGLVVMHACGIDEGAGDDRQKGGYYSYKLLERSNAWARAVVTDTSKYFQRCSVVESHDATVPLVRQLSGNRQNPSIEKARSEPYYPFCIVA